MSTCEAVAAQGDQADSYSCWGLGQEIGIGVIKGVLHRTDQWAYRIPYGLQVSLRSGRPCKY